MKTRTVLLLFAFFTSAVVAQEKPGLYFTCADADQYPARIAYEILDRGLFTQPLERYDFSNKAWVFLGKPDLADALVQRQGAAHYLHFELKDVLN